MHLALKSAMSRIPYTNKVGETLSSIADPAAAYSLRALGGGDPTVARVRRSSDDAEKDFTASDLDSGSVADWVNAIPTLDVASNFTVSGQTYETFTNASNSGFSVTNGSGGARGGFGGVSGTSGAVLSVSFDLNIVTGSPRMILTNYNTFNTNSNAIIYDSSGSYTATLTATGNFNFIAFTEGDIPAEWTISNFRITASTADVLYTNANDGFVTTWYDQSGNSNDATQSVAANQPKIVDGGVLVSDGIDFNASNTNFLVSPLSSNITGSISMFSVSTVDSIGYTVSLSNSTISSNYFAIEEGISSSRVNPRNNTTGVDVSVSTTNLHKLTFGLTTSDTSTSIGSLGNNLVTTNQDYGDVFSGSDIDQVLIGLLRSVSPTGYFDGRIQEIILYDSDQSANRAAIETNINNYYDIY